MRVASVDWFDDDDHTRHLAPDARHTIIVLGIHRRELLRVSLS